MQRTFTQRRAFFALATVGLAVGVPGCVSVRDTHEVAASQVQAIDRLSVESAMTEAALLRAVDALLAIRIERIASDAEASILTDLVTPAGSADLAALDAMLGQTEAPTNPLAESVRDGLMTPGEARAWLQTYADALHDPAGGAARRRLLESLQPAVAARSEAGALSAALRDRAESNARLFADARVSARTLLGASTSDPSIDAIADAALDSWKDLLLEHIDDPEQRAAAERLLGSILDLTDLATTATGAAQ